MKLLVLGGTAFLGRHVAEAALAAGDEVWLFNRGNRAAAPGTHALRGDRNADVQALRGQRFDGVIDCSGYTAEQVLRSAEALGATGFGHYLFVSSISVHAAFPPGIAYDEGAPVLGGDTGYGEGKARAEEALRARLGDRLVCVRPGLIVGPHDPTGRFTYWPLRALRGGAMLAPGRPERVVQWIDVRDLAAWCLHLVRGRVSGSYFAISEPRPMRELLAACVAAAASDARLHWIDDRTLLAAGVQPWTELPLWIPEADASHGGMMLARNHAAVGAGLRLRPTRDTVQATLDWTRAAGATQPAASTLPNDKEAQLLATAPR